MTQATLIPAERSEVTALTPTTPSPLSILSAAVDKGASIETIERLVALQERWQANDARDAYNRAFAAFKSEAVNIVRNITVSDGPLKGKKYADLFAVVDAITPALSKHGLSHSWKLTKDEPAWLEVTCFLRHEAGHCESASMGAAPDTGGAKSPIQARASAKSYLERYTLTAVTGTAASGQDDDGGGGAKMDDLSERLEFIANCNTTTELQRVFSDAYKAAGMAKDKKAMAAIIAAKDARKKELAA